MKSEDFYNFCWKIILKILFAVFFIRVKIINEEKLSSIEGPFIVASNHISNLDPPLLVLLPVRISFMAKKSLSKLPVFGWCMTKSGNFPINRGVADTKAIKTALGKLERGELVGVFPEGTRSRDGKLQKGKSGIGMLVKKANVPVVPLSITGSDKILPKGSFIPRVSNVVIKVGDPIHIDKLFPDECENRDEEKILYQNIVNHIIYKIAGLLGCESPVETVIKEKIEIQEQESIEEEIPKTEITK